MSDLKIKEIIVDDYEKVIEATDPSVGLHCFIAVHNTALGPSLGGTRIYPYSKTEDALTDALRLAKAMTYKSALAQNGLGGGKAVIIANPADKTEALLHRFGEVVDSLKGLYIAAEDVGSTPHDILTISQKTPYVAALPLEGSSGDPSRFTAWGVFVGIQAVAQKLWGSPSLEGKTIALQGLGSVGSKLARLLFWHGASLHVCDILAEQVHAYAIRYGGKEIAPHDFVSTPCDILCPCAMGEVLDANTIPKLHCKAIAGAANNQFLDAKEHGSLLFDLDILYAPDFVINAGGIINAASEFDPEGYDPKKSRQKIMNIHDVLLKIFDKSEKQKVPPHHIALQIAQENLEKEIGKRPEPLKFS